MIPYPNDHERGVGTHSRHSSVSSTSTTGSASTVQGSESFTTKAFKAIENINIRRKLASHRSLFPHDDHTLIKNIAGIYDDLLGFTRPGLYSESVNRTASKLLIVQISSGQTRHLMLALGIVSIDEMQQFLFTIISTCMADVEELHDNLDKRGKISMMTASLKEVMVLAPVINFMGQVVSESDSACQAVLEAGILDMLLRIYVIFPTLASPTLPDSYRKQDLLEACQSILIVLARSKHQETIFDHPVCTLWTDCQSLPPGYTPDAQDNRMLSGRTAWRRAERLCAKRRLLVIYRGSLWKPNPDTAEDQEACDDIIELTRSEFYDSYIVDFAFFVMLNHIVKSGDSAQNLINTITRSSGDDIIRIFSGFMRIWFECIGLQVQHDLDARAARSSDGFSVSEDRVVSGMVPPVEQEHSFYEREKNSFFQKIVKVDSVLFNVIKFATECAFRGATVRTGMLHSGGLALVLTAFVNADYRLGGLIDVPGKQSKSGETWPPSLGAINAEASTLSVLIHQAKFQKNWRGSRFTTRVTLCSMLVDSLFGGEEEQDNDYAVTRALFNKIVTLR